ncbi:MAG: response regulator [Candidatus Margulisbacteria bacterium]|nr:response regulator [Candidatus Margulisiibacteriota bacterium]
MPEMDGLQFLEKARKDYNDTIGVVVITAWEDKKTWENAASKSILGYLLKPFDREDLLQIIDQFFEDKEVKSQTDTGK